MYEGGEGFSNFDYQSLLYILLYEETCQKEWKIIYSAKYIAGYPVKVMSIHVPCQHMSVIKEK